MIRHPWARRFASVVAALALITVSTGLLRGTATGDAGASMQETLFDRTRFEWSAPPDMTGTFAAIVRIEVSEPTRCWSNATAEGRVDGEIGGAENDNPVVFWHFVVSPLPFGEARGLAASTWFRQFQVHAGAADTRELTPVDGDWGMTPRNGGDVFDIMETTVAAFSLDRREGGGLNSPLSLEITCGAAFRIVSLEGGRHARSFTDETLRGGVGFTLREPVNQKLAVNDRLEEGFGVPHVRFQGTFVTDHAPPDADLTLRYPLGEEEWIPEPFDRRIFGVDGPGGDYELEVDWLSDSEDKVLGVLMGVDPVKTLDDAV